MQIIPAIDLKDNKCVRLSKGKDNSSVVYNEDPEKQAIYFEQIGCKKLHLIDLDAAFGRSNVNFETIKKIRKSISIPIQLGGGIRKKEDAEKYFDLGIENLIIGSLSIKDPETINSLSSNYEKKIYVSLDLENNNVMVKGWSEKSHLDIDEILKIYNGINIKGYVVTDITNDGMLRGLNTHFVKNIISKINDLSNTDKKIIIAGGLTSYNDLKELNKLNLNNLEGIISGKSFYVGNIDLKKAQEILNSNA